LRLNGRPVHVFFSRNMECWGVADAGGTTLHDGFMCEEDAVDWILDYNGREAG
jgi:hypothetical protein